MMKRRLKHSVSVAMATHIQFERYLFPIGLAVFAGQLDERRVLFVCPLFLVDVGIANILPDESTFVGAPISVQLKRVTLG